MGLVLGVCAPSFAAAWGPSLGWGFAPAAWLGLAPFLGWLPPLLLGGRPCLLRSGGRVPRCLLACSVAVLAAARLALVSPARPGPPRAPLLSCRRLLLLCRWHSCTVPSFAGGVGAVAWHSSDPTPHSLAELPLVTFECVYIHFHRYWPLPPCCRAGLALLRPPGPCLPPWPLWVLAASLALPCSAPALLALLVGLWRGSALLSDTQPTHAPVHPLAVLLQNRPEVQSPAYIPLWGWPSTSSF